MDVLISFQCSHMGIRKHHIPPATHLFQVRMPLYIYIWIRIKKKTIRHPYERAMVYPSLDCELSGAYCISIFQGYNYFLDDLVRTVMVCPVSRRSHDIWLYTEYQHILPLIRTRLDADDVETGRRGLYHCGQRRFKASDILVDNGLGKR